MQYGYLKSALATALCLLYLQWIWANQRLTSVRILLPWIPAKPAISA